jgi:signal transduction histidine kinase
MAVIGVVGLSSLALVIAKLRQTSIEAEQRAKALEGEIAVRRNAERELRQAKEAAAAANAAKNHFLGNMSHELRTPLNAIVGYTELIRDNIYGEVPERMRQVLERLEVNGRQLRSLINRVLDIAKLEEGRLSLSIGDYSMANIAHTVFNAAEPLAKEKNLELRMALAADLPVGQGDEGRLTQVLMNLVMNAIRFTEVGEVKLAVEVSDGAYIVSVADTGSGIATADQQRIFEDFGSINQSARGSGGVGLGLSVAKRIVELHGGHLWLKSIPGQGSTFHFTIPVRIVQGATT